MNSRVDLSIVIPFYDEEDNVEPVVQDVEACLVEHGIEYELIAVDNGSRDRTGEHLARMQASRPNLVVCKVLTNQGYGWGILCGLRQARGRWVGYMWGDGQVEASALIEIFQTVKEGNVQLAKAKRVDKSSQSPFRRLQSALYNRLFFLLFGVASEDVNGCPKIMRREVYEKLGLQSQDWFIDAEIMIKLRRLGYDFREIAVTYKKREKGQTHVRLSTVLEFARNMLRARLRGLP